MIVDILDNNGYNIIREGCKNNVTAIREEIRRKIYIYRFAY
jgi:hypothetical protein